MKVLLKKKQLKGQNLILFNIMKGFHVYLCYAPSQTMEDRHRLKYIRATDYSADSQHRLLLRGYFGKSGNSQMVFWDLGAKWKII